jgi:phage terminase large subunit-like protein
VLFDLTRLYGPWANDFIEECAAFPNGAHDDQVDAMTQALLRWHMAVQQETVWYLPDYPRGYQISPI